MSQFQIERLRTLPQRPREVWQGGLVRLPAWVTEPGRKPFRCVVPLWISLHTESAHMGLVDRPDDLDPSEALTALVDFACDEQLAGYRPGKLEVDDAALAVYLTEALAELEIKVVHRDSLLAVNRILAAMSDSLTGSGIPGPFIVADMTVERLRSFAEAAKAFYLAAPWRHLQDVDLIRIDTDVPDASLRFATVLGAGGEVFGLGLFGSKQDLWRLYGSNQGKPILPRGGLWQVAFDPIHKMPLLDADLWVDHDLPVADECSYPYAILVKPGGKVRRPTARVLSFLEALLRAVTETDEAEFDRGRWSKEVLTTDGRVSLALSLPELLDPPDPQEMLANGVEPDPRAIERGLWRIEHHLQAHPVADEQELQQTLERFQGKAIQEIEFKPAGSYDEAQDLCYQAFDVQGRRQLQLARQALAICPDCPDAHVILAERHSDPDEALQHYERGVEAGERSLGPEFFEAEAGHFWGIVRTRPYMRALYGLAGTLDDLERMDEAVECYQAMLRLNADDNQGARYRLLSLLIEVDQDRDATALMKAFGDEGSPVWAYARALLSFRKDGATTETRTVLKRAIEANPSVSDYLMDPEDTVPAPPDPTDGAYEAMTCADSLGSAWDATTGAIEWLKRRAPKRQRTLQ